MHSRPPLNRLLRSHLAIILKPKASETTRAELDTSAEHARSRLGSDRHRPTDRRRDPDSLSAHQTGDCTTCSRRERVPPAVPEPTDLRQVRVPGQRVSVLA